MSDKYLSFTQSQIGKLLVKNLGLPNPVELERYAAGDPLVNGVVLLGGRGRLAESLPGLLGPLGVATDDGRADGVRYKGLVFDATGLTSPDELEALRDFFTPVLRSLERCPRVVVIGTPPEQVGDGRFRAAKLLEIVQDQQQSPVADGLDKGVDDRPARVSAHAERCGDRGGDEVGVADRREIDERDAVRKTIRDDRAHFEGDPRLAAPAGPGQGDQTVGREQRRNVGHLLAPSHEPAQLPGQAHRRRSGSAVHRSRILGGGRTARKRGRL